jgi:hypothetical protein
MNTINWIKIHLFALFRPQGLKWEVVKKNKAFKLELGISLVFALMVIVIIPSFMQFIQLREGVLLSDYILEMILPLDVSHLLFILLYSMIILSIIVLTPCPFLLLTAIQSYLSMTVLRLLCIYFIPLEPPLGLQNLSDPIIDYLIATSGHAITKDLFFSGHTATAVLLYLLMPLKFIKKIFLAIALSIGGLLLVQHIHYTIDVLAAPLFAWASYRFVSKRLQKKFSLPDSLYKC